MSQVEQEILVKVPENEVKVLGDGKYPKSELSILDRLMPPLMTAYWFFYEYHIDVHQLEKALKATLSRYQELAGR